MVDCVGVGVHGQAEEPGVRDDGVEVGNQRRGAGVGGVEFEDGAEVRDEGANGVVDVVGEVGGEGE